jgi:biotin carboxylase
MNRHAIIVDPYSAATGYAAAFRARNVSPVAVLTTPEPLATFVSGWHPEEFDEVLYHRGSVDELLAELKAYDPVCVIAGIESGVELAEVLCEVLTPGEGNDPALAQARRDKWQMAQALERAGVARIRQVCTDDPRVVEDWVRANDLTGRRLVLKPPKSGGTDDVCAAGPGQWRALFDRLLGTVNKFDIRNDTVLVQELVEGTEYIVDGYSVDGRFGVVDVCRYRKHASGHRIGIYDSVEFLAPDAPEVAPLVEYTRRVADAVGLRNGASHAEVMLTAEGPRLVEIAARLAGSIMQVGQRIATGDSHIDRTVRHRLDREFTAGYRLDQHVELMLLSAPHAGRLVDTEALDAARELPTVRSIDLLYRVGDQVPASVDLFTILGLAVLAGPDRAAIEADRERVFELQRRVVIAPASTP